MKKYSASRKFSCILFRSWEKAEALKVIASIRMASFLFMTDDFDKQIY
jgi:hypothetical protein